MKTTFPAFFAACLMTGAPLAHEQKTTEAVRLRKS
jgi:hypothetical protein